MTSVFFAKASLPFLPPPHLCSFANAHSRRRNLKKLIILVLSSLVWRSPPTQSQIRLHGGIYPILQCTLYDGHNPYIKEHAVVCLKFLLEGDEENQKVVGELERREIVGYDGGL